MLVAAARRSIAREPFETWFDIWHGRFGHDGGVQGHRPVDLWASVVNREPEAFDRFPQVYIIASGAGLEIGFSVAIHESDYYDIAVKEKNRELIPLVYGKLPPPDSELVETLDERLLEDGDWQFGIKARKGVRKSFSSLAELIRFLRSTLSLKGGGSIYKLIAPDKLTTNFDLDKAYSEALTRFAPLMRALTPSAAERVRLTDMDFVRKEAAELPPFEPSDIQDGRKKVLREFAIRQGQKKFREKLLGAYEFRCAVTGTAIMATLQAAHIVPYKGPQTNSVQNGLLLRADIHNLFDHA